MKGLTYFSTVFVALLFVAGGYRNARAEEPPPPPSQRTTIETETIVPSRPLLASGIITVGLSYGTSVVVGATSGRPEDQHLFVPLVGPWLDFADRGPCGASVGRSCDGETAYKVLLAFDGVVQALGALTIVDAFFTPELRTVSVTTTAASQRDEERRRALHPARVHVAPAPMGAGYGLVAMGTF